MFANEELNDLELSEMLAAWVVPDPPRDLKSRVFAKTRSTPCFVFESDAVLGKSWYGSRAASVAVHAAAAAMLLVAFQSPLVQKAVHNLHATVYLSNGRPKVSPAAQKPAGGGGGGQNMPHPATEGAAPKFAPKQFVPPALAIQNPSLPVVPTITAQAPQISADVYGDPLSRVLGTSGGPGANGLGAGTGGGIGSGAGDGLGSGSGGGTDGGAYRIGGDVSAPTVIYKVEPEYSEEARKAKFSGTVLLSVIIDANGNPREIRVARPLGLGLDEKAIEAVSKWRFRPGTKGGRPVAVQAQVEVNFRLL